MTENGMPAVQYQIPMMPAGYPGYAMPNYGNGGNGMFGDGNFMWFLLVWMAMFGWGGNGWGGNGGNAATTYRVDADIQRGFDQSTIVNKLDNLQQGQCQGFAGVNQNVSTTGAQIAQAVTGGFYNAEIAAGNREMAAAQRDFNMQSAFQQCCCENRAATADLKYTVVDQGCQDRNALAMAVRDINDNANRNHQAEMDKLCQLEMDGIKQNYENRIAGISQNYETRIAALENQLAQQRSDNQSLRFAAAEDRQTSRILADNAAQTVALEQYLAPTAVPAYQVPNPNCCPNQGWGYRQCA